MNKTQKKIFLKFKKIGKMRKEKKCKNNAYIKKKKN